MTIPAAEKIAELRIKHLETLQALITRMAGYGAAFKSNCITVTTAVIGFAFTLHRPTVAARLCCRASLSAWPTLNICG